MMLKRLSHFVDNQNWSAIALELVIVTIGVFIGVQLGNWNERLQTRDAFRQAESRLLAEHDANISAVDAFLTQANASLAVSQSSIKTLRTCSDGPDALAQVTQGANAIRGTATLRLRQIALSGITGNEDYLGLLSAEDREYLEEFERKIKQAQSTLDWLEKRPFTKHIEDAPYIDYSDLIEVATEPPITMRMIALDAPFKTLCTNKSFIAPFYLWERTATFQTLRANQVRSWLIESRDRLKLRATP